jgi:hypothetical protein
MDFSNLYFRPFNNIIHFEMYIPYQINHRWSSFMISTIQTILFIYGKFINLVDVVLFPNETFQMMCY